MILWLYLGDPAVHSKNYIMSYEQAWRVCKEVCSVNGWELVASNKETGTLEIKASERALKVEVIQGSDFVTVTVTTERKDDRPLVNRFVFVFEELL